MRHRDIAVMTDAIAPVLREFLGAAITPIAERLALLEALAERAAALERELAITKEELAKHTERLDTSELRTAAIGAVPIDEIVAEALAKAMAAMPPPKDGTSVTIDDVQPMVESLVIATLKEWPQPKDGTSVTLDD